jgi:hypothetical protein
LRHAVKAVLPCPRTGCYVPPVGICAALFFCLTPRIFFRNLLLLSRSMPEPNRSPVFSTGLPVLSTFRGRAQLCLAGKLEFRKPQPLASPRHRRKLSWCLRPAPLPLHSKGGRGRCALRHVWRGGGARHGAQRRSRGSYARWTEPESGFRPAAGGPCRCCVDCILPARACVITPLRSGGGSFWDQLRRTLAALHLAARGCKEVGAEAPELIYLVVMVRGPAH